MTSPPTNPTPVYSEFAIRCMIAAKAAFDCGFIHLGDALCDLLQQELALSSGQPLPPVQSTRSFSKPTRRQS